MFPYRPPRSTLSPTPQSKHAGGQTYPRLLGSAPALKRHSHSDVRAPLVSQFDAHHSHRARPSLPPKLPADVQVQLDIQRDRIAREHESGSLVALLCPGTEDDSIRHAKLREILGSPTIGDILHEPPLDEHEVSDGFPDLSGLPKIHDILLDLKTLLAQAPLESSLEEHLDVAAVLSLHRNLASVGRDVTRPTSENTGQPPITTTERTFNDHHLAVFGSSLHEVTDYAATSVVVAGESHHLPIVVVACVEELYRTGLYQPHLFRTLPNRNRLFRLMSVFDCATPAPNSKRPYGEDFGLRLEQTADVCALLSTYISSLPEPVLPPLLFDALWSWCVLPESAGDDLNDDETSIQTEANDSVEIKRALAPLMTRIATGSVSHESTKSERIRASIAQRLLHLLPAPNFSLIVYLLAFFSQVVIVREENGVGIEDVGRMFGGKICGNGALPTSNDGSKSRPGVGEKDEKQGDVMLCWLLARWRRISTGIFNVERRGDTAATSLHKKPISDEKARYVTHQVGDGRPSVRRRGPEQDTMSRRKAGPPPTKSILKNSKQPSFTTEVYNRLDDHPLDLSFAGFSTDRSRKPLFSQNGLVGKTSPKGETQEFTAPRSLVEARNQIAQLQGQLAESKTSMEVALKGRSAALQKVQYLESQMQELLSENNSASRGSAPTVPLRELERTLRNEVEDVTRERDEAWAQLADIRRVAAGTR